MLKNVSFKKPNICWAFFFFALLSASSSPHWAQASFREEQIEPLKDRALDSTSKEILTAGILSVWLASTIDNEIRDQHRNYGMMSPQVAEAGDRFSKDAVGPIIALGQLYWDHDNGVSHARALISTGLLTVFLKETIRRDRPGSENHQSMPSGHSSTAFATATSLTYAYGFKAAVVAYPVALTVALSRMADDVHWFSDVVAGAFIGMWMGRASSYETVSPVGSTTMWVAPWAGFDGYGTGLQLNFSF